MKHEHKSILLFVGLFLVAGYFYEKKSSAAAVQAAALTQLQTQGDAGTNVPITPAPIPTTLVEYTGE